MALTAQNAWYFTPCASRYARTEACDESAVWVRASYTAWPRASQSLVAAAADRLAVVPNRTQNSLDPVASFAARADSILDCWTPPARGEAVPRVGEMRAPAAS